jgi:hypothetical protein
MAEVQEERYILQDYLGEPSSVRKERRDCYCNMSMEDMEEELANSGWKPVPGDSDPIAMDDLLASIEYMVGASYDC